MMELSHRSGLSADSLQRLPAGPHPSVPETAPLLLYLEIVRFYKMQIAATVLVGLVATYIISRRMQPVYEAVATLELDRDIPTGLVGDQAERRIYSGDDDVYIATQMKLIQSDLVLRPVAEKFKLIDSPLSGAGSNHAPPLEWTQLKVSRQPNTRLLQIRYRSTDPVLAADVANAIAQGYIEYSYSSKLSSSAKMTHYAERQLAELKAKMDQSRQALGKLERELNLVNVKEKTSLVSSRLLQLNTEYTRAQFTRVSREAAYNMARTEDLDAAQASLISEPLRKLIERRDETREKFSQTKEFLGTEHPEYRKQAAQLSELDWQVEDTRRSIVNRLAALYKESLDSEQMLATSLAGTKAESDRANVRSLNYEQLMREADSDEKVYTQLAQKVKESGVNAFFRNESIRAADPARPPATPVSPNLGLNLVAGFLGFSLLAAGGAIIRDNTSTTVRNRQRAESLFRLPVVGSLPKMPTSRQNWAKRALLTLTPLPAPPPDMLPLLDRSNGNLYAEALRSLNNTVALQARSAPLRTLLVTSAVASEGKTTISLHFALVNALKKRRVLLIDGDLHRPAIHSLLGLQNTAGVADFLGGDANWRETVVQHTTLPTLHILPAGHATNSSLDLAGDRFRQLLDEAAAHYDLVVIDSPPMLCSAETLPLAVAAEGVLFVVAAQKTGRKNIQACLSMLATTRAELVGLVLNGVSPEYCELSQYSSYHTASLSVESKPL